MNPITLLNAIVGSYGEGRRKQMFGADYRERQELERLQAEKIARSIPLEEQRATTEAELAQLAIKEHERKAHEAALDTQAEVEAAKREQTDLGPQDPQAAPVAQDDLIARFRAAKAAQVRKLEVSKAEQEMQSARERSPNFTPTLSAQSRGYLGVGEGATAADVGILEKKRADDRALQIARTAAAARAQGEGHTKPHLTKMRNPETGQVEMAWVTPGEKPEFIGQAAPDATTSSRAHAANALIAQAADIDDLLKDPQVRASLGPAMGRVTNLRELIGNPPPELAGLAGEIESFALANMGVHGMRSVQGSKEISKLLDAKHTPESLRRALHGLLNYAEKYVDETNMRRGTAGSAGAPAATTEPDYIVIGGKLQPNPAKRKP